MNKHYTGQTEIKKRIWTYFSLLSNLYLIKLQPSSVSVEPQTMEKKVIGNSSDPNFLNILIADELRQFLLTLTHRNANRVQLQLIGDAIRVKIKIFAKNQFYKIK